MKKILTLLFAVLVAFSCTELTDLNKNVKDPAVVPGESLFTGAQKAMVDQMAECNVNQNIWILIMQYWTEVTYTDESNYDITTRTIPDNHWRVGYRDVLTDLKEADNLIKDQPTSFPQDIKVKANKRAIVEIFTVYVWAQLVETFGDIPYAQALDIETLLPAYQDGETVYRALFPRLNAAIAQLDVAYGSFGAADNIYQGDVAKWKMFANSLKLRMAMLFADIDNTFARDNVVAAAPGVFASNADNALFIYGTSQPVTNPLYVNLIASGRLDFVACDTIVNLMNALNDPRRKFYFSLDGTGVYSGGPNGAGCTYSSFSNQAAAVKRPSFPGNILDFAQVQFLLAEAVERGYAVGGTAKFHYDEAIKASVLSWGGTIGEANDYLLLPKVDYTNILSGDTWRDKIGTQAWIAFYLRGFDAWTLQRRLNVPDLDLPAEPVSDFPVRFTYPIGEQTLNGANYRAAATAVGGDAVETRLFFDTFGH